jgi:hypothetical protein
MLPIGRISMNCVLCGKTSIDVKIDQFPFSPEARKMLKIKFGINPDEALAEHGVCRECMALPFAERNKLALEVIQKEQDERRRVLIQDALKRNGN